MKKLTQLGLGVALALNSLTATAFVEGELKLWTGLDKQKGVSYAIEKFKEDTGIDVIIESPDSIESRYSQVAANGKGPDIVIFAHDRFGGYAQGGLVREIQPENNFKEKFEPFTWDAAEYKGKYYGYPIAGESVSLIYNKDIIKEPIKNWEDVFALDEKLEKQGKKAIAWAIKVPYFTHPLYSSAGAYVFGKDAKGYKPKDTGVNTPEAKRTMNFIKKIVDKNLMPSDMDYAHAETAFSKGEVAMMINGPWGWANLDKMGMNYGVAELPKFEGKASRPFVGVLLAGINSASPNNDIAQEFIENYLLSSESLHYMNDQSPIGVPALKKFAKELSNDSRVNASLVNARNGDIMPNIPQMMGYWNGLGSAITNVIEGRQSVDDALDSLEKRVLAD